MFRRTARLAVTRALASGGASVARLRASVETTTTTASSGFVSSSARASGVDAVKEMAMATRARRAFATGGGRAWMVGDSSVMAVVAAPARRGAFVARARGFATEAMDKMKTYKPTSPGQRGRVTTSRTMLWKGRPVKALTVGLRKTGGRNHKGRITVWHKGGGHKRLYRMIDFKRDLTGVPGKIRRLEYDPNRSTHIALVDYEAGHKPRYVLAPHGSLPGDVIESGPDSDIRVGNALPLKNIPLQTTIHNIELRPGRGGQLCRSAGSAATLVKKGTDGYCVVRLPSGEQRLVKENCMATIGMLSNRGHQNRNIGKAGANRWRGIRPTTRGVAMNPIDHPHGGGEGRTSGGRPSVTPWGVHTKGKRTRNNKRTDQFRVSRRPRNRSKYKDNK
jgi:large subunit ribosomal protein L2